MKTAEELSGVCSSIYWKYEHGQERQAVAVIEQIQLDAITEGRKQGRIEGLREAQTILADEPLKEWFKPYKKLLRGEYIKAAFVMGWKSIQSRITELEKEQAK